MKLSPFILCVLKQFKTTPCAVRFSCALLVAGFLFAGAAAGQTPTKRILILTGYAPTNPSVTIIQQTIRSTIRDGAHARVEFFYEFQENFRIPNAKYETEMVSYLKRKYEGENLNLVIALSSPALKFLLKNEPVLFTNVPKIFYVHDAGEEEVRFHWPHVTGVWSQLGFKQTLDTALTLHPDTQRVVIVSGDSSQDKFLRDQAEKDFRSFAGRLEFSHLTNLTIEELRNKLATLPEKTVVIFLSYFVDRTGNSYSGPEALSMIAPTASAPIYGISETYLGSGIVGGSLLDFEALGTRAGNIALRVMAGEKDVPIETAPTVMTFDWREMQRWRVKDEALPPGSVVEFRQFTFWQHYRWYVVGIVVATILQAILIGWLLFTRVRRRQVEELLRTNEAQLAGIIGSARDAIITIDENQRIVLFNAAAERTFGRSSVHVKGQALDQLVPECFRDALRRHIQRFGEENRSDGSMGMVRELFGLRSTGEEFPIEASISQLELNGQKFFTVILRDITERAKAEVSLRESEARFRNMADAAPVMIWVSGPDQLYTYCNKNWLDFTGRTMEQEAGTGWTEGIHPDDVAQCREILDASFDHHKSFEMEYRLRHKDGEYRWILDSGKPNFAMDGTFRGYVGSCIDITERKLSEQALRAAHIEVSELKNQLEAENIYLQQELQLDQPFGEIIGHSDAIKYVRFKINQIAQADSTVLIMGETGTGKELVARAIHASSKRRDRALIKVNCAALSPTLIESELFGHEKGAFTGAGARKVGRFELADGGTIFLDEIGELPLELQVKLLRVIQESEFERVGGTKTIKADVRIVAATNRNLKAEVEKGTFRQDLWYRLNVFPITVPPLKQRREDIPLLVETFVKREARKVGKQIDSVPAKTLETLQQHSWPGNVRELANVIERAVIHTQGNVLRLADEFEHAKTDDLSETTKTLEEIEREHILRTLESSGWRIDGPHGAAKVLGLNPSTLRTRMAKLQIRKRSAGVG